MNNKCAAGKLDTVYKHVRIIDDIVNRYAADCIMDHYDDNWRIITIICHNLYETSTDCHANNILSISMTYHFRGMSNCCHLREHLWFT